MKHHLKHTAWALTLAAMTCCGAAQAALFDRGGGMIYDDDRNITWLADWNYAKTSGFDEDGGMDQPTALLWAAGLEYGGYTDWRLPTALNPDGSGPCFRWNCTGSELGHFVYTVLGVTENNSILTGDPAKLALFKNMQNTYWSSTEFWHMDMGSVYQNSVNPNFALFAVAVLDGDVTAIPESSTLLMMLVGSVAFTAAAHRRQRQQAVA